MRKKIKVFITGDIHAEWGHLNNLINKKKPDVIIVCGDFGWWPHMHGSRKFFGTGKPFDQYAIKNHETKIYWCPGNHENWDDLEEKYGRYGKEPFEMEGFNKVFYCPIGSILTVNGMNILFIGGADSVDKASRLPGVSWWRQEVLTSKDLNALPDMRIDMVISHTCPMEFQVLNESLSEKLTDPTRKALSYTLDRYRPDLWYFAHWHNFKEGKCRNTRWTCLNMAPYDNWWKELK